MNLLERLKRHVPDEHGVICVYMTEEDAAAVKRALAIAQAVDESNGPFKRMLEQRADELLRGEK